MNRIKKRFKAALIYTVITTFALPLHVFTALPARAIGANVPAYGDVVINELMWPGSDTDAKGSDADEWIELRNTTDQSFDLSSCSMTRYSGGEVSMIDTFPSGHVIEPHGLYLISNYSEEVSFISVEPNFVTTDVVLSNRRFKVWLYCGTNDSRVLIDKAGDTSLPFKGENNNPTRGVPNKSMERECIPGDGTVAGSWFTADERSGWDEGTTELGTPGSLHSRCAPAEIPTSDIFGCKFFDENSNGEWDDNESTLEGWTIKLKDLSGEILASTVTGEDGCYEFLDVEYDEYTIWELMQEGYVQTYPESGYHTVYVDGQSVESESYDFGNALLPEEEPEVVNISGCKFFDENSNGEWDDNEEKLSGWEIILSNESGVVDSALTGENGCYEFEEVLYGEYELSETQQEGYVQTYPEQGSHEVILEGQASFEYNFGNALQEVKKYSCENPIILDFDFDDQGEPILRGQLIDNEYAEWGVNVHAHNYNERHPQIAITFDSDAPTGGINGDKIVDIDLGTPNLLFGGPGNSESGDGTESSNDTALHNLLIIPDNDVDIDPADGYVDDPNDEPRGGSFRFVFDSPVVFQSVQYIDLDHSTGEVAGYTNMDGSDKVMSIEVPRGSGNSVQTIFGDLETEIQYLKLRGRDSYAIDNVTFCPVLPPTFCGDGTQQDLNDDGEEESCDAGLGNGEACNPEYGGSCSYCSLECTTVDVTGPYCGDGQVNGGYSQTSSDVKFIRGDIDRNGRVDITDFANLNYYLNNGTSLSCEDAADVNDDGEITQKDRDDLWAFLSEQNFVIPSPSSEPGVDPTEDSLTCKKKLEVCDDGNDIDNDECTNQCTLPAPQCSDAVYVRATFLEGEDGVKNNGNGNSTRNVFTADGTEYEEGEWILIYENGQYVVDETIDHNFPGIVIERGEGWVRPFLYGLHPRESNQSWERVNGTIEFSNALITDSENDSVSPYEQQGDLIPLAGNLLGQRAGQDEYYASEESSTSDFFATVDVGHDSYYLYYDVTNTCEEPEPDPEPEPEDRNICGVKFFDHNENGNQDVGDENLSNWTINLYSTDVCVEDEAWADSVVSFDQGLRNNGSPVLANRSNPERALGVAQNNDTINFVALGLGGELVVRFDNIIVNGQGDDIEIVETSYGSPTCEDFPERARVYASQLGLEESWVELGSACQDSTFDLGSLTWARYVKVVDETNKDDFSETIDGYDIDGIRALNCQAFTHASSAVTDENGYCFEDLENGLYQVSEEMQNGWTPTTPTEVQVELNDEVTTAVVDFGNASEQGETDHAICGYKFDDLNGDGVWQDGEPGIKDFPIYLREGEDGTPRTTPTNTDGYYCHTNLEPGTYTVYEILDEGWVNTTQDSINVTIGSEGGSDNNNFGNFKLVSLSGYKFKDFNHNGEVDEGDMHLVGWIIDLFGSSDIEEAFATTETDEDGFYSFDNVGPGVFTILERLKEGWTKILPEGDGHEVTTESGVDVSDLDFLNEEINDNGNNGNGTNGGGTSTNGSGSGGGGGGGGGPTGLFLHNENTESVATVTAVVTWHTNNPATSRVVYDVVPHEVTGEAPNYGYAFSTETDPNKVTFHSVVIEGLLPDTVYYWRGVSSASPEKLGKEITFSTVRNNQNTPPEEGNNQIVNDQQNDSSTPQTSNQATPSTASTQSQNNPTGTASQGTVAGVEFAEKQLLAQADTNEDTEDKEDENDKSDDEPIKVMEDENDGEVIILDTDSDTTATTTEELGDSCTNLLWFLIILNILLALAIKSIDKKKDNSKKTWLLFILIAFVPVIIWYPMCWLVTFLVIMAVLGGLYLLFGSKKDDQSDSSQSNDTIQSPPDDASSSKRPSGVSNENGLFPPIEARK